MIVYDVPGPDGNLHVILTPEEAIRRQRAAMVEKLGRDPYEGDKGDDLALHGFICIHWAWEEEAGDA